ncbi:hypothetical protein [Bradyrhizobium phage BDU-MI-1]|nr:hypothetical protein [Bradyrhizobium phage BDU-MI-1]
MKTFDFQLSFLMACTTRGYQIRAENKDDALSKIEECIDKDGQFDFAKFEQLGGTSCSWHVENGTDHGYEMTDPDSIQPADGEEDEDDEDTEGDPDSGC